MKRRRPVEDLRARGAAPPRSRCRASRGRRAPTRPSTRCRPSCRRPSPGARAARSSATSCASAPTGRINIKQYPGASLVQGQQDREFSAMRQGVIDVLCGAPVNWTGTVPQLGVFTLPFLLPDHKALGRGDGERGGHEGLLRPGAQGRRRAALDRRDRLPADQQQQAADHEARRPEGHQDPRRRQPDVRRDHDARWARTRPS